MKLTRTALATVAAALVATAGVPAAQAAESAGSAPTTDTAQTRADSTPAPVQSTKLKRVLRKAARSKTQPGVQLRSQALCEDGYSTATDSYNYLGYVYAGNVRVCGWDSYFDVSVRVFINGQLYSVGWIPGSLWNSLIRQYPSAR